MQENSSVAIAMPLGRLSPWFDEALSSALSQTFKTPVYLIANGLIEEEIIRLRELENLHDRIRLFIFEERVEIYENWNRILDIVEELYFGMLHDDDILEPWAMEKLSMMIRQCPGQGIYLTTERMINECGIFYENKTLKLTSPVKILSPNDIKLWAVSNRICATGFLINCAMAKKCGGYAMNLSYTADWNLYFTVGAKFGSCYSDMNCGRYRISGKTGQNTNSLVRGGKVVLEYQRQQLLNIALIGISVDDCERELKISTAQFAKMSLHHFGDCLGDDGKKIIKEVLIDGLVMKRFIWFRKIFGTQLCTLIAGVLISTRYPQIKNI
jgi:hypothetical protein